MIAMLENGGEAGGLILSMDWSKSPLGRITTWPNTLLSTLGMMLSSRQPMFLWWGPELIQFYNDAYIPSFGSGKHPAAMGQRGRECWQEIWPIIWPQIDDVMTRRKSSWHEDALVPIERNGRIEEVYWTYGYSPVFDDDGNVGGTLVVCTETTDRVLAARRSEALRSSIYRLTPCTDLDEVLAFVREACATVRLDIPFFLTYRRDADRWSPIDDDGLPGVSVSAITESVAKHLAGHARTGRGRQSMIELPAPPSVPEFVEAISHAVIVTPPTMNDHVFVFGISPRLPFEAEYSRFLNQFVEHVDVVAARLETQRARAALTSERRNLLLQAPMGTAILTGPTHVFELANARYREMVGGRDLVGKSYIEAFPELRGTELPIILDVVYASGEPFVAEEYKVRLDRLSDGSLTEVYFRFHLEPLRDSTSAVYGIMAVAVDVTEQVHARQALEKTTREREKLLRQLEAANRAKDEFLATVSHELRTPLTSILGWSSLLKESPDPSRLQKGLEVIERNARAQAKLIEDILDVSRIISGKLRMNMRRVNPAAVAHAAVETVRPTAALKQIRLTVCIDTYIGTLIADEDRLQQVVWNLLSNAVKFTPKGGEITFKAEQDGSDVVFSVEDTGKGIAPEFLPHIFERFRQDDTSSTKEHAGLGLGLAIVRHLVDLHGGAISARSEGPGHGATFEVRIPIQAVQVTRESLVRSLADGTSASAERGCLRGVHVLVLEDQDDARDLTAMVLEDAGAQVTQADSALRALDLLTSESIDVVVSDIGMPGEDGYAFIEHVRANRLPHLQELPALALTAFARPDDRTRALAAGFQEHVAKPVDPLALVATVAELVQR